MKNYRTTGLILFNNGSISGNRQPHKNKRKEDEK